MQLHLKINNISVGSSANEESNIDIISNEEKELLDLLSNILVQDIMNQVETNEK